VAPFVVNAAFSIEIYLKTIHEAFGNLLRGHDLYKLYDQLSEEPRDMIVSAANDVRPRYKLSGGMTIVSCIKDLNRAFENWRYLYEHERLSTEVQSIRFTMHTLFEASCRVRERRSKALNPTGNC
jgi:HEPN domain-containing protein